MVWTDSGIGLLEDMKDLEDCIGDKVVLVRFSEQRPSTITDS